MYNDKNFDNVEVLERDDVSIQNILHDNVDVKVKNHVDTVVEPEVEYSRVDEGYDEDLTPSSTTMQFGSLEDNDFYEELFINNKKPVVHKEKKGLSTTAKILMLVYLVAIRVIVGLIISQSQSLKTVESSIDEYSMKINSLSTEYSEVADEVNLLRSDEVINYKASEMGMIQG